MRTTAVASVAFTDFMVVAFNFSTVPLKMNVDWRIRSSVLFSACIAKRGSSANRNEASKHKRKITAYRIVPPQCYPAANRQLCGLTFSTETCHGHRPGTSLRPAEVRLVEWSPHRCSQGAGVRTDR